MPVKKIYESQKQQRLMMEKLSEELNPKNKLYKLRSLINWRELEIKILHPKDPFSNYVKEAKDIDAQLNKLISQNTLSLPSLNSEFDTLAEFTQQHPQVNALIKRLKRDKTLI